MGGGGADAEALGRLADSLRFMDPEVMSVAKRRFDEKLPI